MDASVPKEAKAPEAKAYLALVNDDGTVGDVQREQVDRL